MIKVNPSKWEYLKESTLKRKRTKICITCNHFRYSTTETFATILICPRYEKGLLRGDHLLKGCEYCAIAFLVRGKQKLEFTTQKPLISATPPRLS